MNEENISVIFCPPLSKYPEPPADISKSRIIECPHCNKEMWLSYKKEKWMKISKDLSRKILFACYDCFAKMIKENPEMMHDHVRVDI